MIAPGTPKASPAAIAAVQEALGAHWVDWVDDGKQRGYACTCGSFFGRDADNYRRVHVAQAAADAAAPHIAAQAWDQGASVGLRTPPHLAWMLRNPYRIEVTP